MEYRDPINLMDCPSTMEFGYVGYKKGTNNKWTYNLADNLIIYLETIIALDFMTYIVDSNAYELHRGMKISSMTLFMNVRV